MAKDTRNHGPTHAGHRVIGDSIFPPFSVNAPMPQGTAVPAKAAKPQQPTAQAPQSPPGKKKG